ncbi:MAG: sugar phosphate isomerase/epimerase, partial [Planctomycetales bacterium]|nr:sugar phosphate isomerase/epimerase [Planctomycetales bacterium]
MPLLARRRFLQSSAALGAAVCAHRLPLAWSAEEKKLSFKISLAEYSLHRMIGAGKLDALEFAPFTKKEFGIDAVEHWNRPFMDKAENAKYMADMKQRADDAGVKSLLIMIDGEGNLGDPDANRRAAAVANHHKWVTAAKQIGCYSIR